MDSLTTIRFAPEVIILLDQAREYALSARRALRTGVRELACVLIRRAVAQAAPGLSATLRAVLASLEATVDEEPNEDADVEATRPYTDALRLSLELAMARATRSARDEVSSGDLAFAVWSVDAATRNALAQRGFERDTFVQLVGAPDPGPSPGSDF